jgi:hypothetical protein
MNSKRLIAHTEDKGIRAWEELFSLTIITLIIFTDPENSID